MISVCFQVKPLNLTVIQVYAPATDAKEAEVDRFCEDLKDQVMVVACQAPLSMGFSREEYWSGLPFPSSGKDFLELTAKKKKKKSPFHHRGLECKSRKSRDILSNRQVWYCTTEQWRTKANRIF